MAVAQRMSDDGGRIIASHPDVPRDNGFDRRFTMLEGFVRFFLDFFSRPNPLQDAKCRDSYKEFVPAYYAKLFGANVKGVTRHHLCWLRRLAPVLAMPPGSHIVDIGGGFGIDSIFLASLGYRVTFFEITPHHHGVCAFLRQRWEERFGALAIRPVLGRRIGDSPQSLDHNVAAIGRVDAVLLNEVAHHVEPVSALFRLCAAVASPGRVFVLEPNFWNPIVQAFFLHARGIRTIGSVTDGYTGQPATVGLEHIRSPAHWRRLAEAAGFRLLNSVWLIPFGMRTAEAGLWRQRAETMSLTRNLLATHVTLEFVHDASGALSKHRPQ